MYYFSVPTITSSGNHTNLKVSYSIFIYQKFHLVNTLNRSLVLKKTTVKTVKYGIEEIFIISIFDIYP